MSGLCEGADIVRQGKVVVLRLLWCSLAVYYQVLKPCDHLMCCAVHGYNL
jgi:hypothetical protein